MTGLDPFSSSLSLIDNHPLFHRAEWHPVAKQVTGVSKVGAVESFLCVRDSFGYLAVARKNQVGAECRQPHMGEGRGDLRDRTRGKEVSLCGTFVQNGSVQFHEYENVDYITRLYTCSKTVQI